MRASHAQSACGGLRAAGGESESTPSATPTLVRLRDLHGSVTFPGHLPSPRGIQLLESVESPSALCWERGGVNTPPFFEDNRKRRR